MRGIGPPMAPPLWQGDGSVGRCGDGGTVVPSPVATGES